MSRVRSTTVRVSRARAGRALRRGASTGGSAASAAPLAPALGSNVIVFDPSMPVSQIQATIDAIHAQQVDAEMSTNRYALLFEPGVYGSAAQPLQLKVGYYTEVAGLGASPDGRDDQRQDRGLQPLPRQRRDEQLPRARQLLAHAFQPVAEHQRPRTGRLPRVCELLGRLAGRVDAPARHQRRHPLAHGLLHGRAAVRQRRLHRRLAPADRPQRLAAAVADPQQRDRGLVERRLEPGLLGCRGRAVRGGLPDPAVHDPRHDAGQPREAVPVRRRAGRLRGPRSVGADRHQRHHVGRRPDAGPHDPARRLLRRDAVGLGADDQQPTGPRHEPAAHPGRLRRRAEHRGQACRHGRPRPGARDAHRGRRRRSR